MFLYLFFHTWSCFCSGKICDFSYELGHCKYNTVEDQGFSWWGRTPKVDVLTYFFWPKLHENERIWTPGGVPGALLRSATAIGAFYVMKLKMLVLWLLLLNRSSHDEETCVKILPTLGFVPNHVTLAHTNSLCFGKSYVLYKYLNSHHRLNQCLFLSDTPA